MRILWCVMIEYLLTRPDGRKLFRYEHDGGFVYIALTDEQLVKLREYINESL